MDYRKILDFAADVRKFEIGLFWQRSLFFWGLIAASFIAYANLKDADADIRFAVICVGFIFSLGWTLVNRGSKYWQEAWEQKVERFERDVLDYPLFSRHEPIETKKFFLWRAREYSVSKIAIALSDFTLGIWVFLAIKMIVASMIDPSRCWILLALAVLTIGYAGLMVRKGRTSPSQTST
jgi:hypothetical protein